MLIFSYVLVIYRLQTIVGKDLVAFLSFDGFKNALIKLQIDVMLDLRTQYDDSNDDDGGMEECYQIFDEFDLNDDKTMISMDLL